MPGEGRGIKSHPAHPPQGPLPTLQEWEEPEGAGAQGPLSFSPRPALVGPLGLPAQPASPGPPRDRPPAPTHLPATEPSSPHAASRGPLSSKPSPGGQSPAVSPPNPVPAGSGTAQPSSCPRGQLSPRVPTCCQGQPPRTLPAAGAGDYSWMRHPLCPCPQLNGVPPISGVQMSPGMAAGPRAVPAGSGTPSAASTEPSLRGLRGRDAAVPRGARHA